MNPLVACLGPLTVPEGPAHGKIGYVDRSSMSLADSVIRQREDVYAICHLASILGFSFGRLTDPEQSELQCSRYEETRRNNRC